VYDSVTNYILVSIIFQMWTKSAMFDSPLCFTGKCCCTGINLGGNIRDFVLEIHMDTFMSSHTVCYEMTFTCISQEVSKVIFN